MPQSEKGYPARQLLLAVSVRFVLTLATKEVCCCHSGSFIGLRSCVLCATPLVAEHKCYQHCCSHFIRLRGNVLCATELTSGFLPGFLLTCKKKHEFQINMCAAVHNSLLLSI